ncbi:hypothetical protein K0M31_013986 [Melipona bicolor]|uniref:Uncharacterized protein n=1 Tax=Melipona bicolor TaxID=60889 RepID=A0AA40KTV1_9HYME|nr:hypothetical protein K0M31_013986 [Melipona bicolor]
MAHQILGNGSVSRLVLSASPRLQEAQQPDRDIVHRDDSHEARFSPLVNGKDGRGGGSRRGGSGELVIKEGELACVYSRADRGYDSRRDMLLQCRRDIFGRSGDNIENNVETNVKISHREFI